MVDIYSLYEQTYRDELIVILVDVCKPGSRMIRRYLIIVCSRQPDNALLAILKDTAVFYHGMIRTLRCSEIVLG